MSQCSTRTANVAVLNQGLSPGLAGQLLSAQGQARLRSEASALHTEVSDRRSEALVSEARDRLAQQAVEELTQRNLQLNEQAAHAMRVENQPISKPRLRISASRN